MNISLIARAIASLSVALFVPIVGRKIGNKLEAIRYTPGQLVKHWLSEIGSDVRWYTLFVSQIVAVGIAAEVLYPSIWVVVFVLVKVASSLLFLLISIAAIGSAYAFLDLKINTSNFNPNDRRNLSTLLPIATSIIKLAVYGVSFALLLMSLNVNIRPLFELGLVASVILGIAGQAILSDILSTLFIFTDRLFYVGDRLTVPLGDGEWAEGTVVAITLRYTILDGGDGRILAIANRTLDKFQKVA
jgi:small-conductance mechanosensitive channel